MAAIAEQRAESENRAFEPWAWIWQMARRTVPAVLGLAVMVAVFTFGFTPTSSSLIADAPDTTTTLAAQFEKMLPQDGQSSIMFTSSADLSDDGVLSTVMGSTGRVNND